MRQLEESCKLKPVVHNWGLKSTDCDQNKGYVCVSHSFPTLCDPMDCSPPGSSVHGISEQENRGGLPFPSPGDLQGSNPGRFCLLHWKADSLSLHHLGQITNGCHWRQIFSHTSLSVYQYSSTCLLSTFNTEPFKGQTQYAKVFQKKTIQRRNYASTNRKSWERSSFLFLLPWVCWKRQRNRENCSR